MYTASSAASSILIRTTPRRRQSAKVIGLRDGLVFSVKNVRRRRGRARGEKINLIHLRKTAVPVLRAADAARTFD